MPAPVAPPDDCRRSQSCLYQRANEVLILQANYLFAKSMQVASQRGKRGRIRAELGPFCDVQKPKGGGRASERECLESYLLQVKRAMRAMRTAMVRNEEGIFKLAEGVAPALPLDSGAMAAAAAGADQPQDWTAKLKFDAPFFPALEEVDPILQKLSGMLKVSQQSAQGRALLDQELQAWWDSYPRCPTRDEFIAVELVERFPSNPTGEKIRRVKLKPDGKSVEYDDQAFSRAQAECATRRSDWIRSGPVASPVSMTEPALLGATPSALSITVFTKAQEQLVDCLSGGSTGAGAGRQAPSGGSGTQVNLCGGGQRQSGRASTGSTLADSEFKRAEQELDKILGSL